MTNKTTTERPKGAPEFDPTLPCDTATPGNFRRILCTDLCDEELPIIYEGADGCVYQTSKDGFFIKNKHSDDDLVNVWPVLEDGWTCEFIPAYTEPLREGERWISLNEDGQWGDHSLDFESVQALIYDKKATFPKPRLRLSEDIEDIEDIKPYTLETFPLWATKVRFGKDAIHWFISNVNWMGISAYGKGPISFRELSEGCELAGPQVDWQPAHQNKLNNP